MNTRLFLLAVLLLPALCFAQSQPVPEQAILDAAQQGYAAYLAQVPEDMISNYGFSSTAEFSKVTLGKPVRMNMLSPQLAQDKNIQTAGHYLVTTNEWRVPLLVNGQYRAFISVAGNDATHLSCVDFGAAGLASEIGALLKAQPLSNYGILRVHALTCDMIILDADQDKTDYELIPLRSAASFVTQNGQLNKTSGRVSFNSLLPAIQTKTVQQIRDNK